MTNERSRYGLLVSAVGAIVLAIAVFLPWYGISLTATGAAAVSQLGERFAAQFGNAALQSYVGGLHGTLAQLAGRQFVAVSAHQVLRDMNVILLVLAGVALLDSLLALARSGPAGPQGAGGAVVLVGLLASACVVFRMLIPPTPDGNLVTLSLREGSWLALLGSLMLALGGLWPRVVQPEASAEGRAGKDVWAAMSGWTPSS
jgi:hypothetical protein